MSYKHNNRLAMRGIILSSLLTVLSGCANSAAIESLISADPDLKPETKAELAKQNKMPKAVKTPEGSNLNSADATPKTKKESAPEVTAKTEKPNRVRQNNTENIVQPETSENESENLLFSFPDTFPVYPQAELKQAESSKDDRSGRLVWKTDDNRQAVADYYLAELTADDWDVIKPFTISPKIRVARAIAVKDDLRVELSLRQLQTNKESERPSTHISIVYNPLEADIPQSSISRSENAVVAEKPKRNIPQVSPNSQNQEQLEKKPENLDKPSEKIERSLSKPAKEAKTAATKSKSTSNNSSYRLADTNFTDLDEVPPQLQQPIESVAALSILTPYTKNANVDLSRFAPNETITRGEYARWLIEANNRYYADNPGKKIYVSPQTSEPAFKDVKSSHPDFAAIQSLAEAGLISSRLTEDSTNILFKSNAPLTREDLVTWKVPFDTRQSLPQASIEAIEESWGFRDAAKIDSDAVRALYADFQNGDRANVRRMFGYTKLFQPKKPVTRAEAAASLWYFGFQGDGITAKEVLESAAETES